MVSKLLRGKPPPELETLPWPLDMPMLAVSKHKEDVLKLREFL